jgi:hypothetical protein
MNEATWLAFDDPRAMLGHLCERPRSAMPGPFHGQRISDRKLRLFACACCRLVWPLLTDPRSRRAVGVAEWYADGKAGDQDLYGALQDAHDAWVRQRPNLWSDEDSLDARDAWHRQRQNFCVALIPWCACAPAIGNEYGSTFFDGLKNGNVSLSAQAALLRCVAGNPWRPVTLPIHCRCEEGVPTPGIDWVRCLRCGEPVRCPWLDANGHAALRLARAAYDERLPHGLLDPDRLAVLADALSDAGCEEESLLRHLRGEVPCRQCGEDGCGICGDTGWVPDWWYRTPSPTPAAHARGCWALDLILGKE